MLEMALKKITPPLDEARALLAAPLSNSSPSPSLPLRYPYSYHDRFK